MNDIPRRARLDLNTPAELAIRDAINAVEKVGAHTLLTEAVILLGEARDKVADYVESAEYVSEPPYVERQVGSDKKQFRGHE